MRSLRRGGVSVELDFDASYVVFSCRRHRVAEQVPLPRGDLGSMVIQFFEWHRRCSEGARFEIEDRAPVASRGDRSWPAFEG